MIKMYSMSLTVMEEIPETNNNNNIQKFVSSSLLTSDSPTSIAVHSSSSSSASSSCEVSLLNTSDSSLVQMESDLSGKAPDSSTTKLEFTGTTIIPDLTTPSIVTPTSAVPTMIPENVPQHYTVEYLAELVNERKQTSAFSGVFNHTGRLIDEEINRVRLALFQFEFTKEHVVLPAPVGEIVTVTEKVFVPAKSHPEYNFVGRILGPRGMTAKQLEQETSCKVMIRGKGSMRDKKKEDMNRGKPNWEHLSEELHVLIQCEDTKNRCEVKIQRAIEEVRKLLVPAPEGEDELKKKQLMELAIINGTYRTGALQAGIGALGQQALSGGGYGAAAVKSNNNGARMTPTLGNIAPQIRSPTLMQNQLLMQQSAAAQRSTPSAAALAQAHFQAAAMSLANQTGQQQANSMLQAQAQAHLQQSSQGAAEYQMLLNQLQYDPFTNAVALQQQQQQQYAALMLSGANQALLGEYANYEMQGAILPSVQHRNTLHNNPSASSTTSSVRAEAHPYHRHGAGKQ